MRVRCLTRIVSALALPAAIVALMPSTASAWEHRFGSWMDFDASAGYAAPIQAVFQFPAAQVYQLGVQIPVAPPVPLVVRVGDHHVLPR